MKIAILILAHKNEQQLFRLIEHLAADFDLYIHIDKKSGLQLPRLLPQNVHIYKEYNIYWGSYNQIRATVHLLREAFRNDYDRYVLISGQDIPVRTNAAIRDFFRENKQEFIAYVKLPCEWWGGNGGFNRVRKYHLNLHKTFNSKIHEFSFKVRNVVVERFIQKISWLDRPLRYTFYGGANWMNLTGECVRRVIQYLDNHPEYLKRFRWTRCADEIFFQTVVCNECADMTIVDKDLRYVNWTKGPEFPRTLRIEDFDEIIDSDALFARKFDSETDAEIIEQIYSRFKK